MVWRLSYFDSNVTEAYRRNQALLLNKDGSTKYWLSSLDLYKF